MSLSPVDSTPTWAALAANAAASPSQRAASGSPSGCLTWPKSPRLTSRVRAVCAVMASRSKLALVMVMNRFSVTRRLTSGATLAPSARSWVVTADSPLVTYTSRSCMAATSGFLPHTPTWVQPVQPAVS